MKTLQETHAHTPEKWHSYPSIQRWSDELLHVIGLTPAEVASRQDALFQFCLLHEIDPESMAEECLKSEDRVARRAFYLRVARETPANLIVQSFLVHNGVNVFGDLICMPSTRELLVAEQGKQWIRDRGSFNNSAIDEVERAL